MAGNGSMMSEWKLREEMCEVGRRVYAKGFAAANDGNISYRLSEDRVLCSPTRVSKGFMKPDDLCIVDLDGKQQTYLRAAGSLGWAFPASLGAQCAAGDRNVVCFTGDGGFYYHLPELETARRYNIPVTVIVNNNSGFGQNLTGVRRISGNRPGRGEELIRFGPTDFTKVAASFGVRGIRVEEPGRIAPALAEALAANEPIVVDVVTDLEPRAPEAWSPPR